MRAAASSPFYSVLVAIVPLPRVLAFLGAEVELRAARGALANLVSGGTASTPRSHVRVGGAPRRAAPLYISGAVRQPTSRHGHRSLGPTGPAPPGGSGPIRLSASAGAPPACIPPAVPLSASLCALTLVPRSPGRLAGAPAQGHDRRPGEKAPDRALALSPRRCRLAGNGAEAGLTERRRQQHGRRLTRRRNPGKRTRLGRPC